MRVELIKSELLKKIKGAKLVSFRDNKKFEIAPETAGDHVVLFKL